MLNEWTTLARFLDEQRGRRPEASGDLDALILDVALACKAVSQRVAGGTLGAAAGDSRNLDLHGVTQKPVDLISNDLFLRATEWGGHLAGIASEELELPYAIPRPFRRGKYLLVVDPLDGSTNIDVNVPVGSIFAILEARVPGEAAGEDDFLQPGTEQVCAGYAIYGPATMLVLTVGTGVFGFTLEPALGEFILTHPGISIPEETGEFAINASNHRFWEPAVKRYVTECLDGTTGVRGKDFNMRWIASLVAEAHRILMRGGVFLYPRDARVANSSGRLRLLFEANPIAFIVEQAGGAASTGHERVLSLTPEALHQRIGFVFGSSTEVALIERYHAEDHGETANYPLFGKRGLFRA